MSRVKIGPAIEAGLFATVRLTATKVAAWAAAKKGLALFELPVAKTAYIPFGVTLAALLWVKLRGETWAAYGLKPMKSIWRVLGAGLLLTALVLAYSILLQPLVDDFVAEAFGASKTQAADTFKAVVGDLRLYLLVLPAIWIFAAFGEEFFYRGFLMTKIARAFGETQVAWFLAVVVQAAIFGAAHAYQGPVGVIGTGIAGAMYGAATLLFGRSLWPAIIAHGAIDTLGFTLLYLGMLETS